MVRGAVLHSLPQGLPWGASYGLFTEALPEPCLDALDQGLAASLLTALGSDPDGLEAAVLDAPTPDRIRAMMQAAPAELAAPEAP